VSRIPFKLPDDGLREIKGLVYVDEGRLIVRAETAIIGLIGKETYTVTIPAGALEDLFLKKGLFRDRLVIRPLEIDVLESIPGEHIDQIELKVRKKYRRKVQDLVQQFWSLT
jgi:hypothetical protein